MDNVILKPICDVHSWTPTAIKCYGIGCNCSKCRLIDEPESINKSNCCMKFIVIKLIKKFGKPKEDLDNEE